nr:hypothetical protein [Tanacetum cinerariifolium]
MSTQQDIYAVGSENRPPMLNKENYAPWSSRLLRYAKSRPNEKFIHNLIINGPYVRRMILEPGDPNREVPVNETFHVQADDELTEKELKQIEADDQAIQTILLGLPEDIYAAEKKAKLFNEWERFTSNNEESIESYYHCFLKLMNDLKRNKHFPKMIVMLNQDQLSFNQSYLQQPLLNPKDITDPTTTMNMVLALMAKVFKLNYSTSTNNNHRISSNPRNMQIAQPGNLNGYNDVQNVRNQVIQNAVQNPRVQNIRNQNGLIGVPGNANQNLNRNGNLVAARVEGNVAGHNGNYISVEQSEGIVEQHHANVEEARALYDSLCHNLEIEVEKVNTVNLKCKETNAELTTEITRFKNQEKCFEISQEKYDKLERCYQKFVYQEQCLSKKINALHLSSGKQIMTLNEEILDLNKKLSKEKSTVSFLLEEKKKLKSDFKIHEDELLDKQIQLEKRIKELDNILVKAGQSIQMIHMLSPKPDLFYHTKQKMALVYQNPFYLKQAQKKQQSLYDGKVLFEKHDPPVVHDLEETL